MKLLKIKNIGKVVSGSTPKTDIDEFWNGEIPWVTPKEINILNSYPTDGAHSYDIVLMANFAGTRWCWPL